MHDAVKKMVDNGLTGFIDHGGHRWSPEAYAAMDIKTTVFNTARAAVWERADAYGVDTYQVSSHNGARPLCYPWQGKVISKTDNVRDIEDLNGNTVHVYAQSETSYGEAAGLFSVNCKHYPMTFIPGVSTIRDSGQDPEDNEKTYAESQQQRKLERKLREEKRDLEVMKAQGADPEAIRQQQDKVRKASADIDQFCDETGRARRRSREYRPANADFKKADVDAARMSGYSLTANEHSDKLSSGKIDWSKANFYSEKKIKRHVKNHMSDFGYQSKEEYLDGARALLNADISEDVEGFTGKDGFVFRYDVKTNALAIGHPGGSISTYFKPEDGREYWDEQIELHKPKS